MRFSYLTNQGFPYVLIKRSQSLCYNSFYIFGIYCFELNIIFAKKESEVEGVINIIRLDIFENDILSIRDSLQLHFNRTLKKVRQYFFCVSDQEIHFPGKKRLNDDSCDDDHVASSLDDDFRQKEAMPGSLHKSSDGKVICDSFR